MLGKVHFAGQPVNVVINPQPGIGVGEGLVPLVHPVRVKLRRRQVAKRARQHPLLAEGQGRHVAIPHYGPGNRAHAALFLAEFQRPIAVFELRH